jgi:type II secretory pathway predicted ATPase ExeA
MDLSEQSERMQKHYKLHHDPFGALVDAMVFSGAGGRYEAAETIRHLLSYSPQEILLHGQPGSGKRTLAQHVLKMLEDHWRVAWIDGSDTETVSHLLKEIIGQLGLGLRIEGSSEQLLPQIVELASARVQNDEMFLIVVQFADRLPKAVFSCLQEIRNLTEDNEFRIRQLWLADSIEKFPVAVSEDDSYIHHLLPFQTDDASQYLKDRLVAAGGMNIFPFSEKDVARLNHLAKGLPMELNELARDYMIGSTFKTTEKKQVFPVTHLIAGFAALCLVVLAFLYNANIKKTDEIIIESSVNNNPAHQMSSVEEKLAQAIATVEAMQEAQPEDAAISGKPLESAGSEITTVVETTRVNDQVVVGDIETSTDTQTENRVVKEATVSPGGSIEATSVNRESPSQRLIDIAADNEFTMQLIGVRERSKLTSLQAKFSQPEKVDVVETKYKGLPWYILIYGRYASKEAANNDTSSLPEPFAGQQPWFRSFASIRADM